MNTATGDRRRWCRAWPQRSCMLAVVACIGLLTAACGSNSPSTGASGSNSTTSTAKSGADRQKAIAFAQCMRSHGVTKYPDPGAGGGGPIDSSQLGVSESQYQTAKDACASLAPPNPTRLTTAQQQHVVSQLLTFSQCMRSHGLPSFPDPNSANTIFEQNGDLFNLPSSLNPNSSQFVSAENSCKSLMPLSEINGDKGHNRR